MTREEIMEKGLQMQSDYEKKNKPAPENVKGIPTWLDIHGEKRYCLHYPSKNRRNGPVFFDIHGGGFLWGYPEEDDLFCKNMNETLDIEIYSLEYPKAPEHMFPAAPEQLYDTIQYMAAHAKEFNFDAKQIAVGGHSAGGNLAAVLTLMALERRGFEIQCQVLAYPGVDITAGQFTPDMFKDDPIGLSYELCEFFAAAYAKKEDWNHVYCTPLRATREQMTGLPAAVVMTCENDALRFQGREYALKLIEANVPVLAYEVPGAAHAFEVFPGPLMKTGQDYLIRGLRYFMNI